MCVCRTSLCGFKINLLSSLGNRTHWEPTSVKVRPSSPEGLLLLRISMSASHFNLEIGPNIASKWMNQKEVARIAGLARN